MPETMTPEFAAHRSVHRKSLTSEESAAQYSLVRILAIWLGATVPMGVLAGVVWPLLREQIPLPPGLLFWMLMSVGMIWHARLSRWIG